MGCSIARVLGRGGSLHHRGDRCGLPSGSDKLKSLFRNNQRNIGFDDDAISMGGRVTGLGTNDFVPLADVPDDVWKLGGAGVKRTKDNPTHYADMNEKGADGHTLFELCEDPSNISVDVWVRHYQGIGTEEKHQGSLPFRVRQIFEAMVEYVRAGKVTEYVCAAGILAHYVGDACQPLHGSRLTNTNGVHSPYETKMLNNNRGGERGVVGTIRKGLEGRVAADVADGADTAVRTVMLMRKAHSILSPERSIQVWGRSAALRRQIITSCGRSWAKNGPVHGGGRPVPRLALAERLGTRW